MKKQFKWQIKIKKKLLNYNKKELQLYNKKEGKKYQKNKEKVIKIKNRQSKKI